MRRASLNIVLSFRVCIFVQTCSPIGTINAGGLMDQWGVGLQILQFIDELASCPLIQKSNTPTAFH
jgi:hypothetical protein